MALLRSLIGFARKLPPTDRESAPSESSGELLTTPPTMERVMTIPWVSRALGAELLPEFLYESLGLGRLLADREWPPSSFPQWRVDKVAMAYAIIFWRRVGLPRPGPRD